MTSTVTDQRPLRTAIFPGSFDPITNGHVDIIRRALRLFDRIVVAVLVNAAKQPHFTPDERVAIMREVFAGEPGVEVETFDGLLVDYARRRQAIGHRPRAPRGVGLRVRDADGAHEPPPVAGRWRRCSSCRTRRTRSSARGSSRKCSRSVGDVAAFVPPAVERRLQQTREATGGGPRVVR